MINVVIAGNFTFPRGSAASARIRNLAIGLSKNDAQVHILAMSPEFNTPKSSRLSPLIYEGITYEKMGTINLERSTSLFSKLSWFFTLYYSLFPSYRRLSQLIKQGKCDIFISYGRNAVLQWPLVKLCRRHGIPTILDVTELSGYFSGTGGKLHPIYWDWYFGTHYMPRDFDIISTITQTLKYKYEQMGCKNVFVMPTIEDWGNLPSFKRNSMNNIFHLMYIGALIDRDAPDIMLETISILYKRGIKIHLDIIGRYEYMPEAHKRIVTIQSDETLRESISLLGELSDSELTQRMQNVDGLVLLRRNSPAEIASFPTRLVEYLWQGKPVFVSDVGDISLYLRNGQDAILLSPDNPVQVADAIAAVVTSDDRGAGIGRQGQKRGAECFDRNVYAKKLLEIAYPMESR